MSQASEKDRDGRSSDDLLSGQTVGILAMLRAASVREHRYVARTYPNRSSRGAGSSIGLTCADDRWGDLTPRKRRRVCHA